MDRETILDNAVWHSLQGTHRRFAETAGDLAARFTGAVAPFAALPDEPTPDAWTALAALVGPGHVALLFRADVTPPPEWRVRLRGHGLQMVADDTFTGTPAAGATVLGVADVDEMLALVERTKPGPFRARTHELGRYLGIRDDDGRLVAMAGERLRCDGFTEISAVCTDADQRGRGLASALVADCVHHIRARGDTPFLHAAEDNTNAIRVYERLGFSVRKPLDILVVAAPDAPGRD
jgi:ribosomal protein S18 acetylase RimI-like enzyme